MSSNTLVLGTEAGSSNGMYNHIESDSAKEKATVDVKDYEN